MTSYDSRLKESILKKNSNSGNKNQLTNSISEKQHQKALIMMKDTEYDTGNPINNIHRGINNLISIISNKNNSSS